MVDDTVTVSYTHLDVYKRQTPYSAPVSEMSCPPIQASVKKPSGKARYLPDGHIAVSYTHLFLNVVLQR